MRQKRLAIIILAVIAIIPMIILPFVKKINDGDIIRYWLKIDIQRTESMLDSFDNELYAMAATGDFEEIDRKWQSLETKMERKFQKMDSKSEILKPLLADEYGSYGVLAGEIGALKGHYGVISAKISLLKDGFYTADDIKPQQ